MKIMVIDGNSIIYLDIVLTKHSVFLLFLIRVYL